MFPMTGTLPRRKRVCALALCEAVFKFFDKNSPNSGLSQTGKGQPWLSAQCYGIIGRLFQIEWPTQTKNTHSPFEAVFP